jgi:hypothetical protein
MSGWRIFFIVAALFNFAAGLPLLLAPDALLASQGQPVPDELLFHRFTGLLVVCFGLVYALVAHDQMRYRPLVWLGVIGKAGVVALFTEAYLTGRVPFSAYAISLGDLAFVAGFLIFLAATAKRAA